MAATPASNKRKNTSDSQEASAGERARNDKPPPTLVKSSTIVTVNVRKDDKQDYKAFPIHKNYICHYSPYFEAAFNGRFIEGETQEMDIDEVEPRIFGIFVTWLYSQTIKDEDGNIPAPEKIVRLWIFADRILCPRLQNQAIVALDAARIQYGPFTYAVPKLVYDGTPTGSPLRQYLVDYSVSNTNPLGKTDPLPNQLLLDMLIATRSLLRQRMSVEERRKSWTPSYEQLMLYAVDENAVSGDEERRDLLGDIEARNAEESSPSEEAW